MRQIERFAYGNRLARLHPAYKVAPSLVAVLTALLAGRLEVSVAVLAVVAAMSVGWARLPAAVVLRLAVGEAAFLTAGVVGLAVSVGTAPVAGGVAVGPLWLEVSDASLGLAANVLARALACTAAMNFLALTTPVVAIVDLLRALRVSDVLVDLVTLMYRFIFVLLETLDHMVTATQARLGFSGWRTTVSSSGRIGAALFVEAYRRSRRLEDALSARGGGGALNVLPGSYDHPRWALALMARAPR